MEAPFACCLLACLTGGSRRFLWFSPFHDDESKKRPVRSDQNQMGATQAFPSGCFADQMHGIRSVMTDCTPAPPMSPFVRVLPSPALTSSLQPPSRPAAAAIASLTLAAGQQSSHPSRLPACVCDRHGTDIRTGH